MGDDLNWLFELEEDSNGSDDVQVIKNKRTKKNKNETRKRRRTTNKVQSMESKAMESCSVTEEPNSEEQTAEEVRKEEEARKKRVVERQALLNEIFGVPSNDRLILDYDVVANKELVSVHPKLVQKLKSHQIAGVSFMWNSCFESLKQIETGKGGGCILAHCMGLGKTFQVVTLVHTLFNHPATKVNTVLILCPVNTLLNWKSEFQKWLTGLDGCTINIYDVTKHPDSYSRAKQLVEWKKKGGVMIFGYEMFRMLINNENVTKNVKDQIVSALLNPGPDLIVCDEGHVLKNEKSAISKTIMKMKSLRRIVLTGTPLQNNLMEYFCMVQFVKPKLLGSKTEFQNRFAHPISKGQFQNSEIGDVNVMKERSFVLHQLLDGIMQRFDSNELKPYLPPKHEFVILVAMSDLQAKLYQHYIKNASQLSRNPNKESGTRLLNDYQNMKLIWTHPMAMKLGTNKPQIFNNEDDYSDVCDDDFVKLNGKDLKQSARKGSAIRGRRTVQMKKKPFRTITNVINIDCSSDSDGDTESNGKKRVSENGDVSIASVPWWNDLISETDFEDYNQGPKLTLLFAILKQCQTTGEKVLIFSQSLPSLDMIEYFLKKKRNHPQDLDIIGSWEKDVDYFRLDGSTSKEKRADDCRIFNDSQNTRARLFLISTRAGGLGINLTAANRVIIFDVSWNPSNDIQSIFRVYRFGQEEPCYIYRLVSQGTMEEKMYERQITKLSVARRVIDEEQIDRHFTREEVGDLYAFERVSQSSNDTPEFPNDHLMAGLLKKYPSLIVNYYKHDSLLENVEEEELSEAERLQAWREYEIEVSNTAEDAVTSEQMIRSSLKELNPKLTKPKLEKELNMVRDRLLKFIAKEQKKQSSDASNDLGQTFYDRRSGYASSIGKSPRPVYSMSVSRTTAGVRLENLDGGIPISEDPELAIKQLALLHYLQNKIPDDDLIWKPMETPCTYKLFWTSPEKNPQDLIELFKNRFSNWKKKLTPKFTIVGKIVLLHLRFCARKATLQERLPEHHIQVEWVANDLEAAEALLKSRFTNIGMNVIQPNQMVAKTSTGPQNNEVISNESDYKNGFPDASAGKALETPKKKDVKEVVHDVSDSMYIEDALVAQEVEVDSSCIEDTLVTQEVEVDSTFMEDARALLMQDVEVDSTCTGDTLVTQEVEMDYENLIIEEVIYEDVYSDSEELAA